MAIPSHFKQCLYTRTNGTFRYYLLNHPCLHTVVHEMIKQFLNIGNIMLYTLFSFLSCAFNAYLHITSYRTSYLSIAFSKREDCFNALNLEILLSLFL